MRSTLPLLALALLAGCARMDHLGRPPTLTPPGAPRADVAPIAPARQALAALPPEPQAEEYAVASLWRSGPQSLFGDRRARRVGDIVTVVIEINDEASISNTTNRSRGGSEGMDVPSLLGLDAPLQALFSDLTLNPGVGVNSSSSSAGVGATERTEKITMRVAATVVEVLPNGHLVIAGNQEVRVNYELRDLQVAGVVRPEDISRRNEIGLDKIADARVVYGGRGQIFDLQQPRYGQQVLDVILPF